MSLADPVPGGSPRLAALVFPLLVALMAGVPGCANKEPALQLADQLLVNERMQYAARQHDAEATARIAVAASSLARAECEARVAARVSGVETRLARTEVALSRRFEAEAWVLQWERYPRAAERRLAPISRRADEATRVFEAARSAAADRPNDARLAARLEASAAEMARLQRERLAAELDGAFALAERIEALREAVRARITGALGEIRAEIGVAVVAPCGESANVDPDPLAARRAAYAALHSAQVEGLVTIRDHIDRPSAARLVAAGTADALKINLSAVLPESVVSPAVDAGLARIERLIDSTERDLARGIEAGLDALRADLEPGS